MKKEIKNLSVGAYFSKMEISVEDETYENNELFNNGEFNFDALDIIKDNINSLEEVKECCNYASYLGYDVFYFFEKGSKIPLKLKELKEMGIYD